MVWMRAAALRNFRKLWGRIDQDIPAGTNITIQIQNRSAIMPSSGLAAKRSSMTRLNLHIYSAPCMLYGCLYRCCGCIKMIVARNV